MNGQIRPLDPAENKEFNGVMRRCFGWFASFFFDHGEMAYVYEHDGAILGGITISSFRIDDTKRGGIVKWVFTAPEARGHGAASQLIDRAMAWFAEHNCTHVFACIEGYNTGSSNRFAGLGFRVFSFTEQLRSFGVHLPVVWLKTFHVVDIGLFLWTRVQGEVASETVPEAEAAGAAEAAAASNAEARAVSAPTRGAQLGAQLGAFAGTVFAHTVFMYLLLLRRGAAAAAGVEHLWAVPAALVLLFGLRFGAMWVTAAAVKLRLRYRAWETGLLIAAVVPAIFGGLFFAPGGLYPDRSTYKYTELLRKLGPVALSGTALTLALGWALWAGQAVGATQAAGTNMVAAAALAGGATAGLMLTYIKVFLIFDVLLPFFPMASFNGRRVLDWNRYLWALLAAGTAALLLV